jgi:hypothetical protein
MKTPNKIKLRSFPIILITIGILLLIGNFNIIEDAWYKLWPIFLIIIGIVNISNYFLEN